MSKLSIVWIRRNMRLEDNKVIGEAIRNSDQILPIFIFDTTILKRFSNPRDRRLSFIANILYELNVQFQKFNGQLIVLHGNPTTIVPKLAKYVEAASVYADEDFEPLNIERDEKVRTALSKQGKEFVLHVDHLLVRPGVILKGDGEPYRKYSPYMRLFRDYLTDNADDVMAKYTYQLRDRIFANGDLSKSGLKLINLDESPSNILEQIGYEFREDDLWHPAKAKRILSNFVQTKIKDYDVNRNFMAMDATSRLSPYIRFGVVSVRELLHQAWPYRKTDGGEQFINQLIWREFYVACMYHFPESITEEFQAKFRNRLKWQFNADHYRKFCEGKTGYPLVDAGIRQLLTEGWMHNRCRMIVSSFLTKNLFIDWRTGEEFFAQHLMDYDLSSNVGNWQWSASVGVDAHPYIRMFSPDSQQHRFDRDCAYVKRYVPELSKASAKTIRSSSDLHLEVPEYPEPIVDFNETRDYVVSIFRQIG